MKYLIILLMSFSILYSCNNKSGNDSNTEDPQDENPAAEGFNAEVSDQKAIDIADEVMQAMGGRKNWDNERYFKWNFFGARTLWWDKLKGDVRIQMHNSDSTKILVNINDGSGKIFLNGRESSDTDSLSKYLERGKGIWINDAYWLFMPFKLKDSGVTLNYIGEDTTQTGIESPGCWPSGDATPSAFCTSPFRSTLSAAPWPGCLPRNAGECCSPISTTRAGVSRSCSAPAGWALWNSAAAR